MKRMIIILLMTVLSAGMAEAQEGLFVEDLFEGRIIPRSMMDQTLITGSRLKQYGLDTYRSLNFTVGEPMFQDVEEMVLKDALGSDDQETSYTDGRLTYAIICLPPTATGLNRFLCFQAKKRKKLWDITLVYLRGMATVSDLDKMFNKKKTKG